MDKVLDIAGSYEVEENADFNSAPYLDFENAPLGSNLVDLAYSEPCFDPLRNKFKNALGSLDYKTSDGLLDKCLMDGIHRWPGRQRPLRPLAAACRAPRGAQRGPFQSR